jgi:D-apiose dehydrogenase
MRAAPLRVGLAGAGFASGHHLAAWKALAPDARVVAIADPSSEAREKRAQAFAIEQRYASAEEMLDKAGLDALDIVCPREWHAPYVRLAIARGLPVICQKPLAPTLAEAEKLVGEAAGRVRLMVHENWRFRRYYRQARAWIEAGRIGTPLQGAMLLLSSGLLPDEHGRRPLLERQPFMATLDRMLVTEVLIHHLDTLRYLLGPLTVARACIGRITIGIAGEDHASVLLEGAAGLSVTLIGNLAAHGRPPVLTDELEILGDGGRIMLGADTLKLFAAVPQSITYDMADCYQGSYSGAIAHFVDALRRDVPFETSPEDNLETLRLVEAIYEQGSR